MKMMSLAAASALALAGPLHATELVTNGSFETGNFGGWTEFGVSNQSFITDDLLGGGPTDGTRHAAFGPVAEEGGIQQLLETVPGQTYRLSFDIANLGGGINFFTAEWNGALFSFGFAQAGFDYLTSAGFVVATGNTSLLNFRFRHAESLWLLDNVSVTSTAVIPEPASWALLILGFGVIGIAMRRQSRHPSNVGAG
ncbi:MAG: hypothetical protein DCF31_16510 [Alphaproteobacteria bacterium]|nr:MAG: hypothetical protein DCF31_16510 [Alphaproteobacteria bacterium]